MGVFVSICSTRIPYKGAGKEYIGEGLPSTTRLLCWNHWHPPPCPGRHCIACRGDILAKESPCWEHIRTEHLNGHCAACKQYPATQRQLLRPAYLVGLKGSVADT